ncbi:pyridoxal phosphate-dependent aminotransferase [Niveibacterium terrae]|uniref:pyridoxal phosphate-dependent aminotransferase n=1 Tax=Niveibacterium terrae TaxID=3373598 RepID=UPI003A8F615C
MTEYLNDSLPCGAIAGRAGDIAPFHVMELMAKAQSLEAAGRDIIHMEVGEPDFATPPAVIRAAQRFLDAGRVGYTPALGLPRLREAIAAHYRDRFGLSIDPERILVTAGASGALLLVLAALTESGDRWLLPDPGYPCNRNFVRAFGGIPESLYVSAEQSFQPDEASVRAAWGEKTRGIIVASPSNPTGTLIVPAELARIHALTRERHGALVVDEIYQGLTYGQAPWSALALGEDLFVINSFSKYFGMTGWRLGWAVVPPGYVRDIEKLAQHYFISASTPAQHAALAAFSPENIAELERRREEFRIRRDTLLKGLKAQDIDVPAHAEGAFYLYADVSRICTDSFAFAHRLLDEAGIAATPGIDFGSREPGRWLRLAYTTDVTRIEEALARIALLLER